MEMQRVARVTGALVLAMTLGALDSEAQAQQRPLRPGQQPGPNFLVPGVLKGTDRTTGMQVADAIRDRLMSDNLLTSMRVISKKDLVANLEQSGYSASDALSDNDMKQLAIFIRAEEYVDGTVTKADDGSLTLNAFLNIAARNQSGLEQPLPEVTGARAGDLAARISREIGDARKMVKPTNDCLNSRRQRNFEDAKMHAGRAIKEYENSVPARVCLLEVARDQQAPADTLIKISEEILAQHPTNERALQIVVDAYASKSSSDSTYLTKYIDALQKLMVTDPNNTSLKIAVANALAAAGQMDKAKEAIDVAIQSNPGDPELVGMQWRIYRSLGDWKGVIRIGEEMIRHDTAAADTAFYQQLVAAYLSDSQPVKAQEAAFRGATKFSNNATMWLSVAQLARQNGQLPQALEATNRLLSIDPSNSTAALQKAQIYSELDSLDAMVTALRAADAIGAPKETTGGMALTKANPWFTRWARDTAKTVEEGERLLALLRFSDSLSATPASALLLGLTQLTMGQKMLIDAREPRNCQMATAGRAYIAGAQEVLPRAGRQFPNETANAMNGLMQLAPFGDQLVKAICPGG